MAVVPDDLDSLKYIELQQLAKQCGVKANLKADKLKAALSQYRQNQPSQKELLKLNTSERTPDALTKKSSLSARKSVKLESTQQLSNSKASDNKAECDLMNYDNSSFCEDEERPSSPDDEIVIQNDKRTRRTTFEMDQSLVSVESKLPSRATESKTKKFKDWAAIHEREFAKMDSLDVYLEKREERRRRLKTPVKRAAAFAARLTGPQQQPQKSLMKPAVFAPSVLSTSQINFSATFKTPSTAMSKTPFKVGPCGKPAVFNVKENRQTPRQMTGDISLLSASKMEAKRPMFDLQASLARPLTWTPHRGKLKPYSVSRTDVRTYKPKTREERREKMKLSRQTQRDAAAMNKRVC